jgi:putative membrane protein
LRGGRDWGNLPPARWRIHVREVFDLPQLLRTALGGVLMGLANLVPGISGGTMLLAVGIYPRFIEAVARVTRLRLGWAPVLLLGTVVVSAILSIVLLAGTVKDLVVEQRWIMYSLFIGLTLGGLPVVWRMARPVESRARAGAATGFVLMAALALAQSAGAGSSGGSGGVFLMFLAGLAGASAMILPGVSGGYLLLVLGAYVPILSGIDAFKAALSAGDTTALVDVGLHVVVPVGVGVLVGVAAVSNLLRLALRRYEKFTLGFLIGLLLGAVVGLWPFREPVQPAIGDVVTGQTLEDAAMVQQVELEDWPTQRFDPSAGQVGLAILLVATGIGVTLLVDRVGREREESAG